jgi:hypothetical protein
LPWTGSRQCFVLNARKVTESFRAIYNLEEELIAMLRPNTTLTEDQKDEARARILAKLKRHGPVTGSWEEIQAKLDLEDIHLRLFKRCCWHLSEGDRDPQGKSRIRVTRMLDQERVALYERPPFIITAL